MSASRLRVTLRLDVDGKAALGPGKIRLLEMVAEHGSISAAGRRMGMSYKRAWQLIDSLNALFAEPLVQARPGGAGGGGAVLTPAGARVIAFYRALERRASEDDGDLSGLQTMLADGSVTSS